MDKRLLKRNKLLFGVCFGGIGIAAIMLVISLIVYFQYLGKYNEAGALRGKIKGLGEKNPSPNLDNIKPLKADTALYKEVSHKFNSHFGRPFQAAADKFLETLEIKGLPEGKENDLEAKREFFTTQFNEIVLSKESVQDRQNAWANFQALTYEVEDEKGNTFKKKRFNDANWKKACAVFAKEAQAATVEDISNRTDEILKFAFGMERQPSDINALKITMVNFKYRVDEVLRKGNVKATCRTNFDFQINDNDGGNAKGYEPAEYSVIIMHWDVIGDIANRLAKVGVPVLHGIKIRHNAESERKDRMDGTVFDAGIYDVFHYTIAISAPQEKIRKFCDELNSAYKSNRFYAVRSVNLYAEKDDAEQFFVQKRLGAENKSAAAEERPKRSRRGRGRRGGDSDESKKVEDAERVRKLREEAAIRQRERDSKLPYYRRSNYGRVEIGDSNSVLAVFDIEYVSLKYKK